MTTKENNHTPGPWYHRSPTGFVGTVADNRMVASVYGDRDDAHEDDRQIANARLIAAAPDLLEALKDACFMLYGSGNASPKLQAAIDKAEGRS